MIYEWKCRSCGVVIENDIADSSTRVICSCGSEMKRLYTSVQINASSPFQPHFNHSVGEFVSSRRDFENQLKRKSEQQSERTGIDHNYQPVLPGDMPQPKKDDAIFEERNKHVRDKNLTHQFGEMS